MSENSPAVVETEASRMLALIERVVSDPSVDVGKLTAMLDLQVRLMDKQAEIDFNAAMERLAGRLPRITKDGEVTYEESKGSGKFKVAFKFASFDNIDKVIRPHLQDEGMSLSFTMQPKTGEGGGMIVTGTLRHKGGHSQSASIPVALDTSGGKNNTQAAGSSFSYGKRYCTIALLNLVMEGADDDGKASGMKFVTSAQVQQLEDLLARAGSERAAIYQAFEIDSFDTMPAANFVPCANMLHARINAKAKAAQK